MRVKKSHLTNLCFLCVRISQKLQEVVRKIIPSPFALCSLVDLLGWVPFAELLVLNRQMGRSPVSTGSFLA